LAVLIEPLVKGPLFYLMRGCPVSLVPIVRWPVRLMLTLSPWALGTSCCVVVASVVQDEEVVEWSEASALI
jgi:hypothetical protein